MVQVLPLGVFEELEVRHPAALTARDFFGTPDLGRTHIVSCV
jgi:hypothetical protein